MNDRGRMNAATMFAISKRLAGSQVQFGVLV
jgi:hypothetical protein